MMYNFQCSLSLINTGEEFAEKANLDLVPSA